MGSQEAVRGMRTPPRNPDPSTWSQPDVDGGRWAQDPGRRQLQDSAPSLPNMRYRRNHPVPDKSLEDLVISCTVSPPSAYAEVLISRSCECALLEVRST